MTKPRPSPDRVDCYACMRRNPKYKKYHFRVKVCHPEKSQSRRRAVSSLSLSLSTSSKTALLPSFLLFQRVRTREALVRTRRRREEGRRIAFLLIRSFAGETPEGEEREREREVFSLVPPVPGKDNRAWKNIDTN